MLQFSKTAVNKDIMSCVSTSILKRKKFFYIMLIYKAVKDVILHNETYSKHLKDDMK